MLNLFDDNGHHTIHKHFPTPSPLRFIRTHPTATVEFGIVFKYKYSKRNRWIALRNSSLGSSNTIVHAWTDWSPTKWVKVRWRGCSICWTNRKRGTWMWEIYLKWIPKSLKISSSSSSNGWTHPDLAMLDSKISRRPFNVTNLRNRISTNPKNPSRIISGSSRPPSTP